ncbi:MAG: radical SAM protein [Lachnospiraceae bacterium]|nr:radical SAM protein [Lachnospiraceae bacterium]
MTQRLRSTPEEAYKNCTLCPRRCGVDRTAGGRGFCGASDSITAARASLHYWEEPCISGMGGSGTVFFTGCPLGCVYCQNREISGRATSDNRIAEEQTSTWKTLSGHDLAAIFLRLQAQGACNINLVTPTHHMPRIAEAVRIAREQGLTLPIVYNTSGYETEESVRALDGIVDIWLTDCKYYSPAAAARYSGAPDYYPVFTRALKRMVEQTGDPVFETADGRQISAAEYNEIVCVEDGAEDADDVSTDIGDQADPEPAGPSADYAGPLMKRGVIVRHLLLPGLLDDARQIVTDLLTNYGSRIYLSLMNQYTPMPGLSGYPEIDRHVTAGEYDALVDHALEAGLENGFFQGGPTDSESFIPLFDGRGL